MLDLGPKYLIRLSQVAESQAVYQIRDTTRTTQ